MREPLKLLPCFCEGSVMLGWRCRAALVVLAATLLSIPVGADESLDQIDEDLLKKLQADWDLVSSVFNGEVQELEETKQWSFTIHGRKMSVRMDSTEVAVLEIKRCVGKTALGEIDFEFNAPGDKKIRSKLLFKLEGDKLTTCAGSPPGADRPTELTSKAGSGYRLSVSQRRKKTTADD